MTDQPDQQPVRDVKLLHDPVRNKGTAFTKAERDLLGLRGLARCLEPEDMGADMHAQMYLPLYPHDA